VPGVFTYTSSGDMAPQAVFDTPSSVGAPPAESMGGSDNPFDVTVPVEPPAELQMPDGSVSYTVPPAAPLALDGSFLPPADEGVVVVATPPADDSASFLLPPAEGDALGGGFGGGAGELPTPMEELPGPAGAKDQAMDWSAADQAADWGASDTTATDSVPASDASAWEAPVEPQQQDLGAPSADWAAADAWGGAAGDVPPADLPAGDATVADAWGGAAGDVPPFDQAFDQASTSAEVMPSEEDAFSMFDARRRKLQQKQQAKRPPPKKAAAPAGTRVAASATTMASKLASTKVAQSKVVVRQALTVADFTASTGFDYTLNTNPMMYEEAEAWCKNAGGHLATYVSLSEQQEVETYYATYGMLLLGFHKFYWIGAQVPPVNSWPGFQWIDGTPGPNVTGAYSHWGYYMPQNIIEPNNIFRQENCAGANYSQAWGGAWGWSDTKCDVAYPFMCRKNRECCTPPPPPPLAGRTRAWPALPGLPKPWPAQPAAPLEHAW
jgi:hypothetical protein